MTMRFPEVGRSLLADIVAKRFFASRRATLIQKISLSRKIDSSGTLVCFDSCALGGGRRLLQQYRDLADIPSVPAVVRFRTTADNGGFWPANGLSDDPERTLGARSKSGIFYHCTRRGPHG